MDNDEVARDVLDALGGRTNVLSNTVCMTRLRVTLADPKRVNYESLGDVRGVLGTALRGHNGLEVVFGPRVIDGIYHAFVQLTGISVSFDDLFPMSRQETNMRIQIRTNKKKYPASSDDVEPSFIDDTEMSMLENLFGKREDDGQPQDGSSKRLMVVNGPNLNMLGLTHHIAENTGKVDDFSSLLELCKQIAKEAGFSRCDCFQSNHEGDLIDIIQDAYDSYDAIVLAPGAYGKSVAVRDALRSVPIPAIEVHLHELSEPDAVGTACISVIAGHGVDGYGQAIKTMAHHLKTV